MRDRDLTDGAGPRPVLAAKTAIAARAVDPGVSAAIVAAAQHKAVRASAAAAANTADTTLAAPKTAAEQEVTDLTTRGHVVAHAVFVARAEVEATCSGQGDTGLRDRLFAAAERNRENLCSRSTSVFNDKIFSLVTDSYVLLTQAAFGSDVAKCLAAKLEVAASGVTKSKEAAMLLCTAQAIDQARTTAAQLRQVEVSEKAAKGGKAGKGDKRLGKPASAPPRTPAPAPAPAPPRAAPVPAPARRAADSGGGSRGHRQSAPRRRREHAPDSDGRLRGRKRRWLRASHRRRRFGGSAKRSKTFFRFAAQPRRRARPSSRVDDAYRRTPAPPRRSLAPLRS